MSDYPEFTPTTEQVRSTYAHDPEAEYRDPVGFPSMQRENLRAFDRWLAAHDAEVQAQVVAEEPEWEVGVSYSTPSGPSIDGYRMRSYMKVESVEKAQEFAALVERPMIQKRTKAVPAGEWVSVPVKQEGAEE